MGVNFIIYGIARVDGFFMPASCAGFARNCGKIYVYGNHLFLVQSKERRLIYYWEDLNLMAEAKWNEINGTLPVSVFVTATEIYVHAQMRWIPRSILIVKKTYNARKIGFAHVC